MAKLYERVLDIAVQRGFLLPSAEIYGSMAGIYDYGPIGAPIKRKIQTLFREIFITCPGNLEIESATIVPHEALVASGHTASFSDPLVECKKTKKQYRADHLLQEATGESWEGKSIEELQKGLKKHKILSPDGGELGEIKAFNLMFGVSMGATNEKNAYLRPETAQGIFLDFKRIFLQNGSKLPLAIGQVGRSFRNEISPRQGLVRMREFSQMELEYFFNPKKDEMAGFEKIKEERVRVRPAGEKDAIEVSLEDAIKNKYFANQIMATLVYWQHKFYLRVGIPAKKFHFAILPKEGLPHYSQANVDLEINTSYGIIEGSGTSYRTDFDLKNHAKHSNTDLSVKLPDEEEKIIPHVIEPSLGVDRLFYCLLESAYREKSPEKEWEWFDFPPAVAPYLAGVFPLMKKDGLDELAGEIVQKLREEGVECYYSQSGSIGKRYARADEIGVPYCITVDYESKERKDVTIRYRNDGGQERISVSELAGKIIENTKMGKISLK